MLLNTMRNRSYLSGLIPFIVSGFLATHAIAGTIVNPDFETDVPIPTGGWPTATGFWANDGAEIVVSENGITPQSGVRMLRFLTARPFGAPSSLLSSQIHQLIDLAPYSAQVATGNLLASVSYWVNRVSGDSQTDTEFTLGISAFTGNVSDFPTAIVAAGWGNHSQAEAGIFSDGDVGTWENISVDLLIPIGSDYLELNVAARENIFNDTTTAEFDGHYGDNVSLSLTVVSEPRDVPERV